MPSFLAHAEEYVKISNMAQTEEFMSPVTAEALRSAGAPYGLACTASIEVLKEVLSASHRGLRRVSTQVSMSAQPMVHSALLSLGFQVGSIYDAGVCDMVVTW